MSNQADEILKIRITPKYKRISQITIEINLTRYKILSKQELKKMKRYKKRPGSPRVLNAKKIMIRLNFEKNEKRKGILELYKNWDRNIANIIFLTVGHINIGGVRGIKDKNKRILAKYSQRSKRKTLV